jgi:hypothetical protein
MSHNALQLVAMRDNLMINNVLVKVIISVGFL